MNEMQTQDLERRLQTFDQAMFNTPLVPPPAQLAARIMQAARVARATRKPQVVITSAQLAFLLLASAGLLVGLMALVVAPLAVQSGFQPVSLARLFATMTQDAGVLLRALASIGRAVLTKPLVWLVLIGFCVLMEASFASVLTVAFARNKRLGR
ncbi:MAG TPA: hypothetical protein PL074_07060 [Thermoflexales bacterium]|nr:hypothetical protein [Thermoflexales bacterium]